MLPIQPCSLHCAQEELRTVRVRACIGHGEDARAFVLQCEILIRKLRSIDGLAASAISSSEITTLAHELWNDAVEGTAFEMQCLAGLPNALLAGAQAPEILACLRGDVGI